MIVVDTNIVSYFYLPTDYSQHEMYLFHDESRYFNILIPSCLGTSALAGIGQEEPFATAL
jgi:hypothetical protein